MADVLQLITPRTFTDWMYMAKTVFGEARGENEETQRTVAWVIRNRVDDPKQRFGDSIPEVCTRPRQFSAWNPGDPNRERLLDPMGHVTEQQAWYQCVQVAWGVLEAPSWANPIPGVYWYHDRSIAPPPWTRNLQEVPVPGVDRFRFYREA
ncbi:cell wall hydrolase [Carboxydochorda subterranea]|uniref:Cell wall hydrolase n=1 Tax=Carboxydichorda subterranea TaxID=3109565 RepID=A0ABZ1BUZ8_9FIRM|nr:cell wall hydrolase [Limnochorda sp. L945t]WRP16632.1 cell wall hydrolase [Limnochorda sp. L945t]